MTDVLMWTLIVAGIVFVVTMPIAHYLRVNKRTDAAMQFVCAFNEGESTGVLFWWTVGCRQYLYQTFDVDQETMRRTYSIVNVDWMYGDDLSIVVRECYQDCVIMDYQPDYTG